jgi:hypothetical protein
MPSDEWMGSTISTLREHNVLVVVRISKGSAEYFTLKTSSPVFVNFDEDYKVKL